APDFVMHFLPDGSELRGVDSLRLHILEHHKAFPDWSENIIQIVAEGDLVVIHYISTGTNKGRWLLPDLFSMQQQLAGTGKE
ncbi:MAG: ester cyclase, partial [Anaerolineales bacterium]